MSRNLFICQTPFHVLACEAILEHQTRSERPDGMEEVENHLLYFGRGIVTPSRELPWTSHRIFQRPKQIPKSGLLGVFQVLRSATEDLSSLAAASRYLRNLIDIAPEGVKVYLPHFEGALANDIASRYAGTDKVSLHGFPDGLLDVFPLERIGHSGADLLRTAIFRTYGIRFRLRLGPIGGEQHPLFEHYYTFFPNTESPGSAQVTTTQISLRHLVEDAVPTTAPRALLLGQEPVIAAWGTEAYLAWMERAATYLKDRYPTYELLYKPHHSGPYIHKTHEFPIQVLEDDTPVERILGSRNVRAVGSMASTGLVTAKLMLGSEVDAISIDSRPGAMSSNRSFRRRQGALEEAFRRIGVEEVRLT